MLLNQNANWELFFAGEKQKSYFKSLDEKIKFSYQNFKVEPSYQNLYRAFDLLDVKDIKVVIIGQDPYYNKGVATGLSFATNSQIMTRSLSNIFKNITKQNKIDNSKFDTSLIYLVKQGVFLLNRSLAVILDKPNSLSKIGFEKLTLNAIKYLNSNCKKIVYILWGNNALGLEEEINKENNLVIKSTHPSPLSANKSTKNLKAFFEVDFSNLANHYLEKNKIKKINWIKGE